MVTEHMPKVWDEPRVKLLTALYYQDKTNTQRDVRPADVILSVEKYVEVSKVNQPQYGQALQSWR